MSEPLGMDDILAIAPTRPHSSSFSANCLSASSMASLIASTDMPYNTTKRQKRNIVSRKITR